MLKKICSLAFLYYSDCQNLEQWGFAMKQFWKMDELAEQWTLQRDELVLLDKKSRTHRLGIAILLKFFQIEGRFPRYQFEMPDEVIQFVAQQVNVPVSKYQSYVWKGRAIKYHRAEIRQFLGVREATVDDSQQIIRWLCDHSLTQTRQIEHLKMHAYQQFRELGIEPPTPERVERLVRSALRTNEEEFCALVLGKLSPQILDNLDALIATGDKQATDLENNDFTRSVFYQLKTDPGAARLISIYAEVEKLTTIRQIGLPPDLFQNTAPAIVEDYRQRAATEPPRELRRHPPAMRCTLLAAFCLLREQEITDNLVDLLINIVHRIGARAERKVQKSLLEDVKRVSGKHTILFRMALASVEQPDGTIREVLYPMVGEQTLHDLVTEYQSNGVTYQEQVQTVMRASYSTHYRCIVPILLDTLEFRSNNRIHRPVILALELLKKYSGSNRVYYADGDQVPLDGVLRPAWHDLIVRQDRDGNPQINRINYEVAVLEALCEKLRSREVWVVGADRYRNPDEDLPLDFETQREDYYKDLNLPLSVDVFITQLQKAMVDALSTLDKNLPANPRVRLLKRSGGWISVSPSVLQPEPPQLHHLKTDISQRWPMHHLLDILKEADLQIGFTDFFKSVASREVMDRLTLQKWLLLCLYALGTNTGIKRISASAHGEQYKDLLYVRRRFIHQDALRKSIAEVANAIFRVREPHIWGEATTCASDSKKFGATDQNLLTEWHVRYRGPGIMVYWHVEKKSVCIYSQLKSCSSSEVAAMIEGVLRHCTDMNIEKNYVDTHGQSEVAFAFCSLLGFRLMPRLKGIHAQKLYRPFSGQPEAYPHLQSILTRPIQWDVIRQQYDEMVKYATALKQGTADAESILRRFTRASLQHPTYRALAELGKVIKTIFLCQYLDSDALRQEIHEGLNVIESWNSVNSFIFYGKSSEILTNRRDDQEVAILALHLLQICLVYINTLMMQEILAQPQWINRMTPDDFRAITPLIYNNVNPYGSFDLDMGQRLDILVPIMNKN